MQSSIFVKLEFLDCRQCLNFFRWGSSFFLLNSLFFPTVTYRVELYPLTTHDWPYAERMVVLKALPLSVAPSPSFGSKTPRQRRGFSSVFPFLVRVPPGIYVLGRFAPSLTVDTQSRAIFFFFFFFYGAWKSPPPLPPMRPKELPLAIVDVTCI